MKNLKKIEVFVHTNNVINADVAETIKLNYENLKREDTVMKGIYWELDVWQAIQKAANDIGPRMNSRLVNDVMKKYLMEKGYIQQTEVGK